MQRFVYVMAKNHHTDDPGGAPAQYQEAKELQQNTSGITGI